MLINRKIVSILIMMLGLGFFSYPFVSFTINDINADFEAKSMVKDLQNMNLLQKSKMQGQSELYSKYLDENGTVIEDPFYLDKNQKNPYMSFDNGTEKQNHDVVGYILIPKIGVKNKIYLGATDDNLMKGVAQIEGTDMPYGGRGKRCVIAGHRGTYRVSMMFRHLDRLKKGDDIYIYNMNGRLHYKIIDSEIISPSDTDRLLPDKKKDMLSLLTCDPFPTGANRLLVNSARVKDINIVKDTDITKQLNNDLHIKEGNHTKFIRLLNHLAVLISIVIYLVLVFKLISILINDRKFHSFLDENNVDICDSIDDIPLKKDDKDVNDK